MSFFVSTIGHLGIVFLLGMIVFVAVFKNAQKIFDWLENKTFGTKNEILEKLEFLFIEIKHEHLTYLMMASSFGLGALVLMGVALLGSWVLGIILGAVVTFIGFKIPLLVVNFLVQKRIKAYESQMVDALQLLSNGIRAGLSVPQSLGMVVDEMPAPVSQEFNVILQQNKIGVPLEECFENLTKRVDTEDNQMFVTSVNILRETGGNLAEVFDTIVGVIRERIRLKQKVETFVAQGFFQGATIFAMPFIMTGLYAASDPEMVKTMFTHPFGIALALIALISNCIGGYVILRIVNIKV